MIRRFSNLIWTGLKFSRPCGTRGTPGQAKFLDPGSHVDSKAHTLQTNGVFRRLQSREARTPVYGTAEAEAVPFV